MHWQNSNSFLFSGACLPLLLDYFIRFSGKTCFLRAIIVLANFFEIKTSRFKISINSVLHVALLAFQHPWKTWEWTHYCGLCDKLHFLCCCGSLNMAMGSYIITENRFSIIVTDYACWVFFELKWRKETSHIALFGLWTFSKKWYCTEVCI